MTTKLFKTLASSSTTLSPLPSQNPLDKSVSNLWTKRVGSQKPLDTLIIPRHEWLKIHKNLDFNFHPTLFSLIESRTISSFSKLVEHLKKEARDLGITNTETFHTFQRDLSAESILALDKFIEDTIFNIADRGNRLWGLIQAPPPFEERNYRTWNAAIKSADVSEVEELEITGVGNTQLTRIPFGVFDLIYLETLSLESNKIAFLPPEISQLQELITINLSSNQLKFLPTELCELQNLRFLRLSHNRLQKLPQEIDLLTKLNELNLNNNKLIYLPREIGYIKNLDELHLDNNNLYFIPDDICRLANLERLHLSSNNLKSLPGMIGLLKNLTAFDITKNRMTTLSETFSKYFPKLEEPYKSDIHKLISARKLAETFNILENIRFYPPIKS